MFRHTPTKPRGDGRALGGIGRALFGRRDRYDTDSDSDEDGDEANWENLVSTCLIAVRGSQHCGPSGFESFTMVHQCCALIFSNMIPGLAVHSSVSPTLGATDPKPNFSPCQEVAVPGEVRRSARAKPNRPLQNMPSADLSSLLADADADADASESWCKFFFWKIEDFKNIP